MPAVWSTSEISHALFAGRHHLFLRWLILIGVIAFLFLVAWNQGFLSQLYGSDRSYISFLITLLFVGFSLHCAVRTFQMSRQLDDAARISQILRNNPTHRFTLAGGDVRIGTGVTLPRCLLAGFIGELVHKRDAGQDVHNLAIEQSQLLDAYSRQIKGGFEIGWFMADIMIKLGLLGTVVGFIIMLASVTNITSFDTGIMQEVLSAMSSGMGVALYTTLAGLVGGMLLAFQYQLLDRGAEDLIALLVKVVEVQVSPFLKTAPSAGAVTGPETAMGTGAAQ